MPASRPEAVLYLAEMLAQGYRVTTCSRRASAINHYHRAAGLDRPCERGAAAVISGARRERCEKPIQKRPAMQRDLRAMVAALDVATAIGVRDKALLLVGFGSALRRSNLAGLDLCDVLIDERGLLIAVKHEKQDRIGKGRTIAIPRAGSDMCPVQALEEWIRERGGAPGPLFTAVPHGRPGLCRLHPHRIAIVVKHAVERTGGDPREYGAHSLRAGFVTEALDGGAGELRVAAQTGHRSLSSLRMYYRPVDPFAGNACGFVGL
jgi:integrase